MRGKLAEDQGPVVVVVELIHYLHEAVELGRGDVKGGLHQADIASGLTQTGDLGQGLHGGGALLLYLGQGLLTDVVVECPLIGAEIDLEGYLGLLGQFVNHLTLGAT